MSNYHNFRQKYAVNTTFQYFSKRFGEKSVLVYFMIYNKLNFHYVRISNFVSHCSGCVWSNLPPADFQNCHVTREASHVEIIPVNCTIIPKWTKFKSVNKVYRRNEWVKGVTARYLYVFGARTCPICAMRIPDLL